MSAIRVVNGTYRNKSVRNQEFVLVSGFQTGAKGNYVTVKNNGAFPNCPETIRISVDNISDIEYTNGMTQPNTIHFEKQVLVTESDEDAMTRIRERFDILTEMTKAATAGDIRAMIVSGPIGLFQTLYKYSDANCVLVFDDCDSILLDDVALNLLKGALDSGKKRTISWLSESSALRREGIPDRFEFKGSVIFITNLKFDQMKSQKLRDHLDALQSRCHYLDLTLDSQRDKLLRIKQIAKDGVLFSDYDFDEATQDDIIDFMHTNKDRLRELSLRMALKIADLRKMSMLNWKRLAETTCMKSAA